MTCLQGVMQKNFDLLRVYYSEGNKFLFLASVCVLRLKINGSKWFPRNSEIICLTHNLDLNPSTVEICK